MESVSFDGGKALDDVSSLQYKALTWLSTNENLDDYPDWKRIQRYVLAVFYYSMGGDEWTYCARWLSNDEECLWLSFALDETCNEQGRYLRLTMSENNLNGILPNELALLSDSFCTY